MPRRDRTGLAAAQTEDVVSDRPRLLVRQLRIRHAHRELVRVPVRLGDEALQTFERYSRPVCNVEKTGCRPVKYWRKLLLLRHDMTRGADEARDMFALCAFCKWLWASPTRFLRQGGCERELSKIVLTNAEVMNSLNSSRKYLCLPSTEKSRLAPVAGRT